jgi:sugar lactone lactonase YvrE
MFQKYLAPLVVGLFLLTGSTYVFGQQLLAVQHFAGSLGGPGTRDGVGSDARFQVPIAVWGDGTYLYIADQGGRVIRRVDADTGEVHLIAGSLSQSGAVDGVGTDARFYDIQGLWGDGVYLYIADLGSHGVRLMTIATTEVTTLAPTPVDGDTPFNGLNGPLSIWGTGQYLYVVDTGTVRPVARGALRRIDLTANTVSTIALPPGPSPNAVSGNSNALFVAWPGQIYSMDLATGAFQLVADITLGTRNGIWGGDNGFVYSSAADPSVILRVNPGTGDVQPILGAANQPDWIDGVGTQARFRKPQAIWGDGNRLYIADTGNHAIRTADLTSLQVTTLAGMGMRIADQGPDPSMPAGVNWSDGTNMYFGTSRNQVWRMPINGGPSVVFSNGTFNSIIGIWGDGSFLYVVDNSGYRIQKVSLSTGDATTLVSLSGPFASFATIPSNNIWGDGTNLFVAGNTAIYKIDATTGAMQVAAGIPDVGGSTDGLPPKATFYGAAGIWGDGTYLYIADNSNRVIRRMNLATNEVTTLAGQVNGQQFIVDGIGMQALFASPANVWGDGSNLYITDRSAVRRLTLATGEVRTIAGPGGFVLSDGTGATAGFSSAGTIWGKGNLLYVEDQHRVRTVDVTTDLVLTIAGLPAIAADGIGFDARFNNPTGIWGDGGYLYVTDMSNHVLRRIDRNTAQVLTVAGKPGVAGALDGIGSQARFNSPIAVCSDGTSIFIADDGNHAIRRVSLATWQVTTFAGTLGKSGPPETGQFVYPYGLWCDRNDVYASDYGGIRRIHILTGETQILFRYTSGSFYAPLWSDGRFLYFPAFGGMNRLDLSSLQVTNIGSISSSGYANIWADAAGLYFMGRTSIQRFDLSSGTVSTIAALSRSSEAKTVSRPQRDSTRRPVYGAMALHCTSRTRRIRRFAQSSFQPHLRP